MSSQKLALDADICYMFCGYFSCMLTFAFFSVPCLLLYSCRVMVIAGNITPIDVICHIPILCEQADIPYIYVPSKEELGAASATKRPTSCILVVPKKDADWLEAYEKVKKAVKKVQPTY